MKPIINSTKFGSITINNKEYSKDMLVYSNGTIKESPVVDHHSVSRFDLEEILNEETELVISSTGQSGCGHMQEDAKNFLEEKEIEFIELKTPDAIKEFNKTEKKAVIIVHLTC